MYGKDQSQWLKQQRTSLSTYTICEFEEPKLSGILPVSKFEDRSLNNKNNRGYLWLRNGKYE